MNDRGSRKVSLWAEDALAAAALAAVIYLIPQVVFALEKPKAPDATAVHYAGIIATILSKPTLVTVDGEAVASCRVLRKR